MINLSPQPSAWDWAENQVDPRAFRKLFMLITLIPVFILAATGVIGMIMLVGFLFAKRPKAMWRGITHAFDSTETKNENSGCLIMTGLAVVMSLINYGLSYPVWALTPVGEWYEAIDQWSRSHGWADGGSILFCALLWQWVWIPLSAYFLANWLRGQAQNDN